MSGVPDVPFRARRIEAHRQSLAVAASSHARDDQDYIDAVGDWGEEGGVTAALRQAMTVEEFLAWDDGQEGQWEFDGFQPVAMVGGTQAHAVVTTNIIAALVTRLRDGPCRVYNDAPRVHAAGSVRHPDVFVSCSPLTPRSADADEPVVVFEVLSPSTAETDLMVKVCEYGATPSIQRYVVVAQDRVMVTVHARQGRQWATETLTDLAEAIELPEIGTSLPLAEVYRYVVDAPG